MWTSYKLVKINNIRVVKIRRRKHLVFVSIKAFLAGSKT